MTEGQRSKVKGQNYRGFTLLELLITISIIAILAAVGFASYSKAQETTRDFRRKSDLRAIQTASELYFQKYKVYPNRSLNSTAWGGLATDLAPTYINTMPVDPVNSSSNNLYYYYTSTSPNSTYTLCTNLENDSDKDRVASACSPPTGGDFLLTPP